MIVPLVMTPKLVKRLDYGFFLTESKSKASVVFNSGWVTLAFLNLRPVGLINLSYLGGFLVKLSPTKVTLLIFLFHAFYFLLPVFKT